MKEFNVIIEDNGTFRPYNIMPYLDRIYRDFVKRCKECGNHDEYFHIPKNLKEIKEWVKSRLKYQYWSRCEYEIILQTWPNPRNESGKKVDIYWQCEMNIDLITRLFIEEIYIPVRYNLS